ncbi:quaternary amine ABC transporter ATP-binding protein [Dichotomicrobium thermohalophilum]|uniref:Quaternary amine transport ATP-binding protein n=1 Tax=Dichotomicrobium thermohalophilum TaxID=933063 RepID=A0A397PDN3_9HYPH|nr:glycine betaine/L-proline ABC transporter ATP-binding protein [Dichotomicrobium thermohalophilum]RIA47610.1 glycine betaine/proline transport system ATP-binding protein [Dichotomicrobium thermohalophilum]
MSYKLTAENVYKIFGPEPDRALEMSQQGASKDEVFRETKSVVAVNDVSFKVPEGQIFVVMGLSGSGKSTLIRCLNRLFEPTAGKIYIDDFDITAANEEELRQVRLKRMAMVFQHFALFPHMSVWENAAYGLKARNTDVSERREQAVAALKSVGLDAWADSYPKNLSGGMQQRVGLARALAVSPEVLLMDEPFSALDPLIRRDTQDELIEIQERLGSTIVFITHDLQEALKLGDQIAIMKDGRFVQVGTPQQIVMDPADDYVFEFTRDVDRSRVLTFGSIRDEAETLTGEEPLDEVTRRFEANENLKGMFVVDDKNKPVGLVDRDRIGEAEEGATARSLMDRHFAKVRRSSYICESFDRLGDHKLFAVVDREGKLRGVVDPMNVFQHLEPPTEEDAVQPGGRPGERPDDLEAASQPVAQETA